MKEHPVVSEYILSSIELLHPFVRQIARSSHERMDGKGYPDGKAGEEIPLPARIVFVADAFDALTSERPYRSARTCEEAVEELRRNAGTQFCPKVIAAFEQVIAERAGPSWSPLEDSPGSPRYNSQAWDSPLASVEARSAASVLVRTPSFRRIW